MHRAAEEAAAAELLDNLRVRVRLDQATPTRIIEAARIKAGHHPMSFADASACATASSNDASLLTGDPEIIGTSDGWQVEDLRASRS